MITLTAVELRLPEPVPGAHVVACRFTHDSAGLAGGVLEAPDGTRLALPRDQSGAVPKRQAEYLAGRWCAGVALRAFGAGEHVPALPDRSPGWPAGYVGSITHAAGCAIAVVARDRDYRALGVDLEALVDDATAEQLAAMILRPAEWARQPAGWPRARMLTVAFSAKEALYKAVYPNVRRVLEFHDVELVGVDGDALTLTLGAEHRPAALPDESYRVAYRVDAGTCLTVLALPRPPGGAGGVGR